MANIREKQNRPILLITAPDANDDITKGFLVGHIVLDTVTKISYVNTINTATMAQWIILGGVLPIVNVQIGTTYTLTQVDIGAVVLLDNISPITLTLPETTTEDLPTGFNATIIQSNIGQITVVIEGTDLLLSADNLVKTRTQNVAATVIRINSQDWFLSGDLTA